MLSKFKKTSCCRLAAQMLVGFFCIFASSSAAKSLQASDDNLIQYELLYEQLIHLEPDFDNAVSVQNFTFQRDVAKFTLAEGKLYLCKSVMNRVCAAVFRGKGRFQFAPPIETERKQLYRFYKTGALDQEFNLSNPMFFVINPLRDLQYWIYLSLYRDLEVDSVSWAGGQEAVFFKGKKNPYVWIKCDPALRKDQTYTVRIDYHGELFRVKEDWVFIKSPNFWFPRINYRKKAKYNLGFYHFSQLLEKEEIESHLRLANKD